MILQIKLMGIHFTDVRGDMEVVRITHGRHRNRKALITWGKNLTAADIAPYEDSTLFAALPNSQYHEKVICWGN